MCVPVPVPVLQTRAEPARTAESDARPHQSVESTSVSASGMITRLLCGFARWVRFRFLFLAGAWVSVLGFGMLCYSVVDDFDWVVDEETVLGWLLRMMRGIVGLMLRWMWGWVCR